MQKHTETIIKTILENDQTISGMQRQTVLATLSGDTSPIIPALMSQIEAAKFLGVSRITIYNLVKGGHLKPVQLPTGLKRYRRKDLEKLGGIGGE